MSPTFERIEPVSKKTRVLTLLRKAILSGEMKGGEQIVETKLAHQFGVGQGLVREALIELEHHGFVQRTPFSGTIVQTLTLEEALQILEVRIELEPLAFDLAVVRAIEKDVAILNELIERTKLAAETDALEEFFESHLNFRRKVWHVSGNRYIQQALERVVIPLYALYLIRRSYDREAILECIEHQDKVLDAFHRKDPETARLIARDFLIKMKDYLETRLVPELAPAPPGFGS